MSIFDKFRSGRQEKSEAEELPPELTDVLKFRSEKIKVERGSGDIQEGWYFVGEPFKDKDKGNKWYVLARRDRDEEEPENLKKKVLVTDVLKLNQLD